MSVEITIKGDAREVEAIRIRIQKALGCERMHIRQSDFRGDAETLTLMLVVDR